MRYIPGVGGPQKATRGGERRRGGEKDVFDVRRKVRFRVCPRVMKSESHVVCLNVGHQSDRDARDSNIYLGLKSRRRRIGRRCFAARDGDAQPNGNRNFIILVVKGCSGGGRQNRGRVSCAAQRSSLAQWLYE